ncbi:PEGA domain-containing protein [Treponema sp. J25]|uniref:PEGA domain-containing protein n=1 Tax=Treponema sp. J25 TaxID=2094121 RepID=UPI0014051881|nr:PEGA domain-containing protein [Treponema sp. J25]
MKNVQRLLVFSLVTILAASLFAQAMVNLTIEASEGPAQVILNGKLYGMANPRLTIRVAPGIYELVVRKSGLPEFRQRITVPATGLVVQAPLGAPQTLPPPQTAPQPIKPLYTLSIQSNVAGAQVSVNGSNLGSAPVQANVEAGTYQIQVTANGYEVYQANIQVSGNTVVTANLKPLSGRITISANVNGAEVFLNGVRAGVTPFTTELPYGSYNLKVSAPGYQDYTAGIVVSGPQNLVVSLIPMMGTIRVSIPAPYLVRDHKNPLSLIDLYVDGVKQRDLTVQVVAGTRKVTLVTGVITFETTLTVEAGRTYVLEPTFGFTVRQQ